MFVQINVDRLSELIICKIISQVFYGHALKSHLITTWLDAEGELGIKWDLPVSWNLMIILRGIKSDGDQMLPQYPPIITYVVLWS
jgi:hypothetical protein